MPRRGRVVQREIAPDPVYRDRLVAKFVNTVMRKGKKSVAERIVYGAFTEMSQQSGGDPVERFKRAIEQVKPVVEVRSRRVGGATYQVPIDVRPSRRIALTFRWILQAARQRSGRTMQQRLAAELQDAANKTGGAVKKREDTHRMAEANRAFAHYRW